MSVLYLYALVGDPPRADAGLGLRRERLQIFPGRAFHVVAGRMDAAPAAAPATLRRHDTVVRRIAATVDAILPMRFGLGTARRGRGRAAARAARDRAGRPPGPRAGPRADDASPLWPAWRFP